MNRWHILTCEYPPDVGGVSDYTSLVAEALVDSGDEVHVWCAPNPDRCGESRVVVHPEAGRFAPSDLRKLGARLDEFPPRRRLLLQWVPHGFGYGSMNVWLCLWLAMRRVASGDQVELMVHEPFMELRARPLRHLLMAIVQRLMTAILLWSATRVWVAIPAWATLLKPYMLGRQRLIEWLPIPGCLPDDTKPASRIREQFHDPARPVVGHFGSFGREVSLLLQERLASILDSPLQPCLLLIGRGSNVFADKLVAWHPDWANRVHATGYVIGTEVGGLLAECDVLVQPYPDGISTRRTSVMACLSRGCPVVTTSGHLTEPLWATSRAVILEDVSDPARFSAAVISLLQDAAERGRLARQGKRLYSEHFDLARTVAALRAA